MVWWHELAAAEPAFAARVRNRFTAFKHSTLATLRKDGSPRISATEVDFSDDGPWLGSIAGSLKALDLRRDPRLALHCATVDTPDTDQGSWVGDAKIAGLAHEVTDPTRLDRSHRFRIELTEVVFLSIADTADHLVIDAWNPERGLRRQYR